MWPGFRLYLTVKHGRKPAATFHEELLALINQFMLVEKMLTTTRHTSLVKMYVQPLAVNMQIPVFGPKTLLDRIVH